MAKKIREMAVSRLSNGAHFNFMQITLERAKAATPAMTIRRK